MASITIRNLDDDVKTRLQVRAAGNDRSVEEEARLILGDAIDRTPGHRDLASIVRSYFGPSNGVDLELPPRGGSRSATMVLSWMKCVGDVWCKLERVNLDHDHFDGMRGVYIIWHGGQQPRVVHVGQGLIRDRLLSHRTDPDIQHYAGLDLYVTWAPVEPSEMDGVEAYLADHWHPEVGVEHPNVPPIKTNSPW